jgi:peptidoglycan hydrolase-like protein with peptidoglycan-binding domain
LRKVIKNELFQGRTDLMREEVNSIQHAYNQTAGLVRDLLESGLQKIIPDDPDNMRVWGEGLMTISSRADIDKQVEAYRNSYDAGNNVIVVAHSQGNLFAIRAYKTELFEPDWMHIVHIASPSHYFASNDVVFWDNDIVSLAGLYDNAHEAMKSNCLVRKVEWSDRHPGVNAQEPKSDFIRTEQVGHLAFHKWNSEDDGSNSIVHSFRFYMGEPLKEDIANQGFWNSIKSFISEPKSSKYKKIPNAIDGTDLIDTQAKDKILGYIKTQLDKNSGNNLTPPTLEGGVNIVPIEGGFKINSQEAQGQVDRYEFYRSQAQGELGDKIHEDTTNTYEDKGLSDGVTYYYTIKACNDAGCATSKQDNKTYNEEKDDDPTPPTLEGGVNIVPIEGGFKINSQEAQGQVDRYEFYRSQAQGELGDEIHEDTTNTYEDKGLSDGVTYYYTIKACNDAGCATSKQDYNTYHDNSGNEEKICAADYFAAGTIKEFLKKGDRDRVNGKTQVEELQSYLYALGIELDVDGIFGSGTEAAVKEFQQATNIDIDGQVGPQTREKINDPECNSKIH